MDATVLVVNKHDDGKEAKVGKWVRHTHWTVGEGRRLFPRADHAISNSFSRERKSQMNADGGND